MTYTKAIMILENIDKYSDEEIPLAIYKVLSMETINAVTKNALINAVKYLFDKCYEVEELGG